MWERIKLLTLLVAVRVVTATLPAMASADSFLVDYYERFVADPLQVRGISLSMQLRGLYGLGALFLLFSPPLSLWNLPGFVLWFANAVFLDLNFLEPPVTEEICRNPTKVMLILILLRCFVYWIGLLSMIVGIYFPLLLTPILLTTACDAKPPRPKRLTRLVSATEGV